MSDFKGGGGGGEEFADGFSFFFLVQEKNQAVDRYSSGIGTLGYVSNGIRVL